MKASAAGDWMKGNRLGFTPTLHPEYKTEMSYNLYCAEEERGIQNAGLSRRSQETAPEIGWLVRLGLLPEGTHNYYGFSVERTCWEWASRTDPG